MADVEVSQSQEAVALELFKTVASVEGRHLGFGSDSADRAYVISTYAECLAVVKGSGRAIVPEPAKR